MLLSSSRIVGFVATIKHDEARRFYEQTLELRLVEENPFALVFSSGNASVRIQKVESVVPAPYTTLGWEVTDIAGTAQHLISKGVEFQRFEGLSQDEAGIWLTPDGSQVAWFQDPDGNTLSLTEHVPK